VQVHTDRLGRGCTDDEREESQVPVKEKEEGGRCSSLPHVRIHTLVSDQM